MPLQKALPFLTFDKATSAVTVGAEAAAYLASLPAPVVTVSVAGTARNGKSFLANQILGRTDGFDVKAGMGLCTRGIWLWPAAQYVQVSIPAESGGGTRRVTLIVLDCQGVCDAEEDRLFCIAAALSTAVVYNSIGAIDEIQLELVASLFSDTGAQLRLPPPTSGAALTSSAASPYSASLADALAKQQEQLLDQLHLQQMPTASPPTVIFALRDFSLALRDETGAPLTARQYLEASLGSSGGGGSDSQRARRSFGGRTGALLRRLLPRRECVVLPRPVADEKLLPQLHRLPPSTLRPRWSHGVAELRGKIHECLGAPSAAATAAATIAAALGRARQSSLPPSPAATGTTGTGTGAWSPPLAIPWFDVADGPSLLAAARAAAQAMSGPPGTVRFSVPYAASACALGAALRQREQSALTAGLDEPGRRPSLEPSVMPSPPSPHPRVEPEHLNSPLQQHRPPPVAPGYSGRKLASPAASSAVAPQHRQQVRPSDASESDHLVAAAISPPSGPMVPPVHAHGTPSARDLPPPPQPLQKQPSSAPFEMPSAREASLRLALRRLLRFADLSDVAAALRTWSHGCAAVDIHGLEQRARAAAEAQQKAEETAAAAAAKAAEEVAAARAAAEASIARAEGEQAAAKSAAEVAVAQAMADAAEEKQRAADKVASFSQHASASEARAVAAERLRQREATTHEQAYAELQAAYERMEARVATLAAARAQLVDEDAAHRSNARDAYRSLLSRSRILAVRGILATSEERQALASLRRSLLAWSWGVAAHTARTDWRLQLSKQRMMLLRQVASRSQEEALRQALRRWHSGLVVSAVDYALAQAQLERRRTLATRHAQGALTLVSTARRREAKDLAYALGSWVRACLASETHMGHQRAAHVAALQPQLAAAREAAREAVHLVEQTGATLRVEFAERERVLTAQVSQVAAELDEERSRARFQVAHLQEESDELVKAAAEESARLREATTHVKVTHARQERVLLHWCGGHLAIAFLRHQAAERLARAMEQWAWLARVIEDDELYRMVGSLVGSHRPSTRGSPVTDADVWRTIVEQDTSRV